MTTDDLAETTSWAGTIGAWALALLGALLLVVVATVPLAPPQQAAFGALTALAFLVANQFRGRRVTLCLVALSLAVSLRYIAWRLTDTLHFDSTAALLLGAGLVLAEAYAVAVLALGYMQTAWPLRRTVRALPPDPAGWPSVDVYVTTYNEPMSVVRATVLAATALDWPADRLHVWLLDDGRREEFRRFAEQIGCDYLARADNAHAKAGNLNHALRNTQGEFVAVFDCDHVPTRAFLQLTMGWLVAEPNLALVQTPQHFYSPDPFQRNLASGARVPGESQLFHGLVQDGRDTWNAAQFSGSCAVLRRAALEDVGGVASETVTEDAQTTLKLHRRGWDTAFLRLPLAAGLATERLALHLRQRVRWARGMLQMLRLDNPLSGPGLTLAQRLCHLQAAGHFLFALPRVVFLTAPLAFLLLGQNIIAASPLAITAYAVPHIFHAVATGSRIHGRWRHSFWSAIYETVLALFLVRVTIATLVRPRRGGFDVTAKGGLLESGVFDLPAVWPNLVLAGLLLAGLARGVVSLAAFDNSRLVDQALAMNAIWAALSLLTVLAALAVGRERRQVRSRAMLEAALPVSLLLPDGKVVAATTSSLSQSGGHVAAPVGEIAAGTDLEVVFTLSGHDVRVLAHVLRADAQGVQLEWEPRTLAQEQELIQAIFGRADAWSNWADYPADRPWLSLGRVLASIGGLFRPRERRGPAVAVAGIVMLALLLAGMPAAHGQGTRQLPAHGTTIRPLPQQGAPLGTVVLPSAPRQPAAPGLPAQPVPPPPAPAPVQAPIQMPAPAPAPPAPPPGSVRRVVLNLHQIGAPGPLSLRGTSELQGVDFGLRSDEVVTAAQLSVAGAMSPALLPESSNITVSLNDQYVGTIPANRDQATFATDLPVSPEFFKDNNHLSFGFTGRYTADCNDPLSGLLWATVSDASTLTLTLQRLPPQRDLARLPQPFLDVAVRQPLVLPMVLPAAPGNDALRAAGIVSSWFGAQAGFRGASFPVAAELPAQGNAALIVVDADGGSPPLAGLPPISGPTLAIVPNPADSLASILVVAGRTGEEAVAAATALGVGNRAMAGAIASVTAPALAPRTPYDAPNWIAADRPVRLGELVEPAALQSSGYTGLLHVPFRTAPDFFTWRDAPFPLHVRFRAPPGPIVDVAASRLDVGVNGSYLDTLPLAGGSPSSWLSRLGLTDRSQRSDYRVDIPAYAVSGLNDLQFYFDARPLQRGDCSAIPGELRMAVDPDSTLDLSRGIRFTELPNLAYFLTSGFPFTRMADLSETAVVVGDRPSLPEIGVFLDMMGRIGAQTGIAATRLAVSRPDGAAGLADRDLLLIGTISQLGTAGQLLAGAPLRLADGRLDLALPSPLDRVRHLFGDPAEADRRQVAASLSTGLGPGTALLVGGQSPLSAGRSVVALLANEPADLAAALDTLRSPEQALLVQGDLALLTGGIATSYRIGTQYTVGHLPFYLWPGWALRDQPVGLAGLALIGCVLLGLALFWGVRRRAALRTPRRLPRSGDGPA